MLRECPASTRTRKGNTHGVCFGYYPLASLTRIVGYPDRASIMAARERYHRDEQLRERRLRKAEFINLQKV
jgi:hypothetical protein